MGKLCSFTKTTCIATRSTSDSTAFTFLMAETSPTTPGMERTLACTRTTTAFPVPEAKTYQLEDGSIRIEVGKFWKIVSSWHLVDTAENQLIHAYRSHYTN